MKLRHLVVLIVVFLLCGVVYVAYMVHRYVSTDVPNAYAAWGAGSMVVDYLRQNDDRWPQSWDELWPICQQRGTEGEQARYFDDLKSRIEIRWDVDVDQVRGLPAPPDDLIFLRDGGRGHWAGYEPNEMVHSYLADPEPASHRTQLPDDARDGE